MGKAYAISALASAVLLGAVVAAPAVHACGKTCAGAPAAPAPKKNVNGNLASKQKSKGNIDDYWSPCNSDKLTDYMYCQP